MQLNRDLEGVIEGLHTGYYQEITIDPENNRVHISEPWNGKILYGLGYRTNVDELSHYLLDKVRESTVKLQNQALSKEERLQTLTTVKLLRVLIRDERIEHSPGVDDSLIEIKKISTIYRSSLAKEPIPSKPEEIIGEINRFGQDKMSVRDQVEQNLYFNERTKEVLKAYKSIETATKKMRLHPSDGEIFTIQAKGNENILFRAYPLSPSQKFMVHATHLSNAIPLGNRFKEKEFPASTMCVSLIDSKTGFFGHQYTGRAGLILGVDPKQIVLTSPLDICSPVPSVINDKSKEKRSYAYQFYHNQQRVLRLAERIEQIHKASGYVTYDFASLRKLEIDVFFLRESIANLTSIINEREKEINKYEKELLAIENNKDWARYGQKREERLKYLREELDFLKPKVEKVKISLEEKKTTLNPLAIELKKNEYLLDFYNLPLPFPYLLAYYHENSEKNLSSEEFQKIFGYSGQNIIKELEKYASSLRQINNSPYFVKKLESPEDLLAATGQILDYNEINIKLDIVHARTPSLEGILVTRKTIEAYTAVTQDPGVEEFTQMILYAQKNNIPIFMLDAPLEQPRAKL